MNLPANIEAEQALLGALMVNNDAYEAVRHFLKADDFSEPLHQRIYGLISDAVLAGRKANPVTLIPFLPNERIGDMTMPAYMARLAGEAVTVLNAEDYGRAIYDAARRRELCREGQSLIDQSCDAGPEVSPWQIRAEHDERLKTTCESWDFGDDTGVTLGDAVSEAIQATENAFRFKRPVGITTGIEAVDGLTGPWEAGQQIIIGGATKQGKSALAMQCAIGLARHGTVWVYSGEMTPRQLAMREIARRTGIPAFRQKEGRLSQREFEKLVDAQAEVNRLRIIIERRRMTLEQIHRVTLDIKRKHGLAAMVVDHIGLLGWGGVWARREMHEQASEATRQLKAIYGELGIPGITVSQLKKNTFGQDGRLKFHDQLHQSLTRRPRYTDLYGAVEYDADHVIIPFNPSPLIAAIEPMAGSDDYLAWEDAVEKYKGRAEIVLALSREQPFPRREAVEWHGETTSFGPPIVGRQEALFEAA